MMSIITSQSILLLEDFIVACLLSTSIANAMLSNITSFFAVVAMFTSPLVAAALLLAQLDVVVLPLSTELPLNRTDYVDMLLLIRPILFAFLKSESCKKLIVDVLYAMAKASDNKLDDHIAAMVKQALLPAAPKV